MLIFGASGVGDHGIDGLGRLDAFFGWATVGTQSIERIAQVVLHSIGNACDKVLKRILLFHVHDSTHVELHPSGESTSSSVAAHGFATFVC